MKNPRRYDAQTAENFTKIVNVRIKTKVQDVLGAIYLATEATDVPVKRETKLLQQSTPFKALMNAKKKNMRQHLKKTRNFPGSMLSKHYTDCKNRGKKKIFSKLTTFQ